MKWRFVNTEFNDGAYNMAVDEAIMQCVAEQISLPTLRFYGWVPPSVSLGYFQSAKAEVDTDACISRGITMVRRLTGGRAILHDKELTYSVIIPESYPEIPASVTESYRILSNGLLEGLGELGIEASMVPQTTLRPNDFASGACFDAPSSYELVVQGKKLVGSAQVRQKGVILQHGSILNEMDADTLFACLAFPNEEVRQRSKSIFLRKAISMNEIKGKPTQWDELCSAFYKGFEKGLNITLMQGELSQEEIALARELKTKYLSDEWNYKK